MNDDPTIQVTDVEVDRHSEVRIRFGDGTEARFGLADLRRACPCAGCRGQREQGRAPLVSDSITIRDAELHGAWGMSLRWDDGHDTGIFSWELLRRWFDARTDGQRWEPGADSLP